MKKIPASRHPWAGEKPRKEICHNCGTEFHQWHSELRKARNHFCCRQCYHASQGGEGNPNWKGGPETKTCLGCGKEFKMKSYGKRPTDGRYCNKECQYAAMRKTLTPLKATRILDKLERSGLPLPLFARRYKTTERILRRMLLEHFPDRYETILEARRLSRDHWYTKGRAFEYRVRDHLRSLGFVVMRSPRSGGPADLMAARSGLLLLVQCKLYGSIPQSERDALCKASHIAGGTPILAARDFKRQIALFQVEAGHRKIRKPYPLGERQ